VIIWMTLAAIAVLGILAWTRLPAELNPRVDIPTLTITTIYPGAGPQEIESLITRPLEEAVGAVNNVQNIYSSSQDSVSVISMDFNIGTNLDHAFSSVKEKVESARALLPKGASAPIVARLDINSQPVLYVGLSAGIASRQLRRIVDLRIKSQISRIPGVAAVDVLGGEKREIHIAVSKTRLLQCGLTIEDVINSIKAANHNIPAGSLSNKYTSLGVRTMGAFSNLADIRKTQILSSASFMGAEMASYSGNPPSLNREIPAPLTVGDVATVTEGNAPLSTITRVNGKDSIALIITKSSDANTVDVANLVKEKLAQLKYLLPPDTQYVFSRDDSVMVKDALDDVEGTLVLGAVLAMLVVFLFLNTFRGTIIVSIALPACIIATFLVMYFAGYTLNQMTLLALSLSVGILIDDSMVVLESITRHLKNGEPPDEAAWNGRSEIGFADITTTLVDVVVFLPIAFMGGIVGAFFKQFGMTVVVATLFSLLVSFTVTPSLASRWYRQGEVTEHSEGFFKWFNRLYHALERKYQVFLRFSLRNRWWVVGVGFTVLAVVLLVTLPVLGFSFLPSTDQGQISITVQLPPDASLSATDHVARLIEKKVAVTPDVLNYVTTVGEIPGGFGDIPQKGPQFAQINVRLTEKASFLEHIFNPSAAKYHTRTISDNDIAAQLRKELKDIPEGKITVTALRSVESVGQPVQIQLRGSDLNALMAAATQLKERLSQMPGILDAATSVQTGQTEVQVHVDRSKAAALNIPVSQIGQVLRDSIEGNTDNYFDTQTGQYPILINLANVSRSSVKDLQDIPVGVSNGAPVTLGQVAEMQYGTGPVAIERSNGERMVTVTANLAPGYALGNAQQDINAQMADIPMTGINVHWGGESETMAKNISYFVMAFALAIILVYLVMASLFNSLLNPFIIMFSLPMALAGALVALVITGESLSLVALIGVIMLTGLMGRNAILLIDYTGTLRARGHERNEAIVEAGSTRMRPILMTSFATIFGMLPVALRVGRASEIRAPMAIVVIGGLLVSTFLTLVIIPVIYSLFDDWFGQKR